MARILFIDDNPDILEMVRLMLESRGQHQVEITADGEIGLEKAFHGHYDLIIVDLMMPTISGHEVIRRLRKEPSTAHVPILVLSARGQPIDKRISESLGANLHLSKPVRAEKLRQAVERLVSGSSPQQGGVIPLFSLRGGSGRTLLATHLALLLQQIAPTLLLDLSPQGGHCAPMLALHPRNDWRALPSTPEEGLTPQQLVPLLTPHSSGLRLLAAPESPQRLEQYPSSAVWRAVLAAAKSIARFIVIDMPPLLDERTLAVMEQATQLFLISGSDRLSLQSTLQTLHSLSAWKEKIRIIVNHPAPQPPLKKARLEHYLHHPVALILPYQASATTAILHQRTLLEEAPQSPLVKGLRYLARLALGETHHA